MSLKVNEIFTSIQGEGPFVGLPACFIRLSGCNVSCEFCDTDHKNYFNQSVGQIMRHRSVQQYKLVVITGGEPLLQNLDELIKSLSIAGHRIQIETNGTQRLPDSPGAHVVCSPKEGTVLHPSLEYADAWKYVVDVKQRISTATGIPVRHPEPLNNSQIYYQPMDGGRYGENVELAYNLTMRFRRRLSLQMHKIIGVE